MSFIWEAETWVAVAFLILMAIFWKLGVPAMVTKSLDDRADRIKSELDEARRLKDEAQKILAEAERRRRDAEKEAEGIIAGARADAERVAAEAKTKVEEFVARRTKMAEAKITQAEHQAVAGRPRCRCGRRGRCRRTGAAHQREGQDGRRSDRPGHQPAFIEVKLRKNFATSFTAPMQNRRRYFLCGWATQSFQFVMPGACRP